MAPTTGAKSTDLEAFRTTAIKEADESFAEWYLDGSGAQFNKAETAAFMEGIKAAARLGAEFARTPERKAAKVKLREAAAAAAKESAAKRAATAKEAPKKKATAVSGKTTTKAKPAAATDLI